MNYKKPFNFDKSKLTHVGILFLFGASVFIWTIFSNPKIHSTRDLYFIQGHFRDYNFHDYLRSVDYTFRLKEYSNSFKIKADFLGKDFKVTDFRALNYGSELKIAIAKDDSEKLNTNEKYFFVFAVTNDNTIFLDPALTVRKFNDNFEYYASAFFFIFGLIFVIFGLKNKK